jgi:hypothetical protein
VRFALHGSSATRHLQIDWDVPVGRDDDLRAAMAGHDVDAMHAGTLRRGYQLGQILFPRGTIVLRVAEGHEIFLQLPPGHDHPEAPPPPRRPTLATVAADAVFDRHQIVVGDPDDGERIDLIIAGAVPALSRAVVQRLIDGGHASIGGVRCDKSNRRVRRGELIELAVARIEGD